jgi:hypothetical protein
MWVGSSTIYNALCSAAFLEASVLCIRPQHAHVHELTAVQQCKFSGLDSCTFGRVISRDKWSGAETAMHMHGRLAHHLMLHRHKTALVPFPLSLLPWLRRSGSVIVTIAVNLPFS